MKMNARYKPARGQTSLEYILLLTVVAVVVISSFRTGSWLDKVHDGAGAYYNTVTSVIMGARVNAINGAWCPVTCPPPGSYGMPIMYRSCECPAPAFGGLACTNSNNPNSVACPAGETCQGAAVYCNGVHSCGACPPGEVCTASGCACPNGLNCSAILPGSVPDTTCSQCLCPNGTYATASGQCGCCPYGYTSNGSQCVLADCGANATVYYNSNTTCHTDCECDLYAHWDGHQCSYCATGQFWNGTSCTNCPTGQVQVPTIPAGCTTASCACNTPTCSGANMYWDTNPADSTYLSCACDKIGGVTYVYNPLTGGCIYPGQCPHPPSGNLPSGSSVCPLTNVTAFRATWSLVATQANCQGNAAHCQAFCNSGYTLSAGQCVKNTTCSGSTPTNSTRCTNYTGAVPAGTTWSLALFCDSTKPCLTACSSGYAYECVGGVLSINPVNGQETCTGGTFQCVSDNACQGTLPANTFPCPGDPHNFPPNVPANTSWTTPVNGITACNSGGVPLTTPCLPYTCHPGQCTGGAVCGADDCGNPTGCGSCTYAGQSCVNGQCTCPQAGICPDSVIACGAGNTCTNGAICDTVTGFCKNQCGPDTCGNANGCGGATPCPNGSTCTGGRCSCTPGTCPTIHLADGTSYLATCGPDSCGYPNGCNGPSACGAGHICDANGTYIGPGTYTYTPPLGQPVLIDPFQGKCVACTSPGVCPTGSDGTTVSSFGPDVCHFQNGCNGTNACGYGQSCQWDTPTGSWQCRCSATPPCGQYGCGNDNCGVACTYVCPTGSTCSSTTSAGTCSCPQMIFGTGPCQVTFPESPDGATPVQEGCPNNCSPGGAGQPTATCSHGVWSTVTGSCGGTAPCAGLPVGSGGCGSTIPGTTNGNSSTATCPSGCTAGVGGSPTATCSNGTFGTVTGECICATSCSTDNCGNSCGQSCGICPADTSPGAGTIYQVCNTSNPNTTPGNCQDYCSNWQSGSSQCSGPTYAQYRSVVSIGSAADCGNWCYAQAGSRVTCASYAGVYCTCSGGSPIAGSLGGWSSGTCGISSCGTGHSCSGVCCTVGQSECSTTTGCCAPTLACPTWGNCGQDTCGIKCGTGSCGTGQTCSREPGAGANGPGLCCGTGKGEHNGVCVNNPGAPTLNSATAGTGQVVLAWSRVTVATGYSVKYGTTSGTFTTTIDAGNVTGYTVTGLTQGTTYYFVVVAYEGAATSANSNQRSATLVPNPPTLSSATAGSARVTLTWTASPGAASYKIKHGTVSGTYTTTTTVGNVTTYTVTGLAHTKLYYFVVVAHNAGGDSTNSNERSATTT